MFDSGIKVKTLVDGLKDEVDIALDIPNATYVQWLNSLQQLLYTEVIKEQKMVGFGSKHQMYPPPEFITESLNDLLDENEENESKPRFEDIHTVYANGIQLIKTTLTSGVIFPNCFYKDGNDIYCRVKYNNSIDIEMVYFAKPAIIEVDDNDNIIDANIMIPIEFIDLVKAKLRGEAYKLANEDNLAAKWLNDYNVLLETFKAWITEKSPTFGM